MSNFNNYIFSTNKSLARIDTKVSALSLKKVIDIINASTNDVIVTIPTETSSVTYIDTSNNSTTVAPSANTITLSELKCKNIKCYNSESELIAEYECDEGQGTELLDVSNNGNNGSISIPSWGKIETTASWQDKIDIAKDMLASRFKHYLKTDFLFPNNRRYDDWCVDYGVATTTDELLDLINNLEDYKTASDYLALALIYWDLTDGNSESMYRAKAESYDYRYTQELISKLGLMELDLDNNGQTDIEVYDRTCRLLD